jgi:hypothetical protein
MVLHIRQPFGVKETCFLMKSEAHSESLLAKVSQQ